MPFVFSWWWRLFSAILAVSNYVGLYVSLVKGDQPIIAALQGFLVIVCAWIAIRPTPMWALKDRIRRLEKEHQELQERKKILDELTKQAQEQGFYDEEDKP